MKSEEKIKEYFLNLLIEKLSVVTDEMEETFGDKWKRFANKYALTFQFEKKKEEKNG